MAFLLQVILGIVACFTATSLAASDEDTRKSNWERLHPTIPYLPDVSLPSEEIDLLPEEFAGSWWSGEVESAAVTRRSYQTPDRIKDREPPLSFKKILKYKTSDGSLMVRVTAGDGHHQLDFVFRYVPKSGVVVNSYLEGRMIRAWFDTVK